MSLFRGFSQLRLQWDPRMLMLGAKSRPSDRIFAIFIKHGNAQVFILIYMFCAMKCNHVLVPFFRKSNIDSVGS